MQKAISIIASLVFCTSLFSSNIQIYAETSETSNNIINVTIQEDGDPWEDIQAALNTARDMATVDSPYTVIVPPGNYCISRAMRIYSNTVLDLSNSTFTKDYNRTQSVNFITTGNQTSSPDEGPTGYAVQNSSVINGCFDSNNSIGTMMKIIHASNISIDNCTFTNAFNSHAIEVACVDGLKITNSAFSNLELVKNMGALTYEAIQLDIPVSGHIYGYRSEAASVKNATISQCSFENVPRGIGSHTAAYNIPYTNIKVLNNTFKNISSSAIEGMYWKNSLISGNKISNTPKGIQVSVFRYGARCTYLASRLAQLGNVPTQVSDNYKEEKNYNIKITNNTISLSKTKDPYQDTIRAGIRLVGTNLTQIDNSGDGSDDIPLKNYYMSGVTVEKNKITTTGYGIHVDNTRNTSLKNNTIKFIGKDADDSTIYHGLYVKNHCNGIKIQKNTISSAERNGISILGGSSANEITGNYISSARNYGICVYDNGSKASYINDNTISSPGLAGICVNKMGNVTQIKNNKITSPKDSGIVINNKSSVSEIEANSINNTLNHGITIYANSSVSTIIANRISKVKQSSINLNSSFVSTISNNTMSSLGKCGINVYNKSSVTNINSNSIASAKEYGIRINSKSKAKNILKNTISTSKVTAISVNYWSTATNINNNSISNSSQNGIAVQKHSSVTNIKKNKIAKSKKYGILATSKSKIKKASANKITGTKKKTHHDKSSKMPKKLSMV